MSSLLTAEPATESVSQPRSSRRWLIIGVIALVFVVIIGYVLAGAALAAGPVSRADSALKTAVSHNNTIADLFSNEPFKNVDFSSSNPDISGAKSALAKVRQDLARWQADVSSDRTALLQAQARLQSSLLTLPEQSTINSHRHRVDAGLAAMATAQPAIDIFGKQLAFLDPFFDVIGGFIAMGTRRAPTTSTRLVSAVQARDLPAIQKYAAAVEADGKALETIDSNAIDKAEQAVFKPLGDAYDRDMKTAAGG